MGQTVGINVSYKTDPFICPAVFCIIIVGDVIDPVQAVIKPMIPPTYAASAFVACTFPVKELFLKV